MVMHLINGSGQGNLTLTERMGNHRGFPPTNGTSREVQDTSCRGLGMSPSFPFLPPRLGARGLKRALRPNILLLAVLLVEHDLGQFLARYHSRLLIRIAQRSHFDEDDA
jgi:hypothetical protein